jgi:hypothetical protein
MGNVIHKTEPVRVWVDVDEKIAYAVRHLNTIANVRTLASCQGTLGEGGDEPYRPYVMVWWGNAKARRAIEKNFELLPLGPDTGYARPPLQASGGEKP